jgi:membrane-bound ClpP family serine protease
VGSSLLIERLGLRKLISLRPPEREDLDHQREGPDLARFVGLRGRTASALRPSGVVDFGGRRLDGFSESGFIDPGAEIVAVQVRSGRLIVRAETPLAEDPGDVVD